ncbi:Grx4 family monothiol glutaredoxin [Buchnera aphidicola]|uniref:Glutaredoxin n=1 Tax=Buchnera aphidicola (Cinara strobi) TaxID=1921549 RepID=A0A3B1E0B8_9GAMM|nr:Grx4 family monothiol glutaredoxin [Buchnera aphidicola]VAX76415.1 Glutaredoxin 4 [Buchnera aphidicola (Cinara strobi)]
MTDAIKRIKQQLQDNNIVIYMKGSPEHPSCGFSSQAVQALSSCTSNFFYVDVLKDSDIRLALPKYSQWPTFPQLWINKRLIGGCDIILEMLYNGELLKLIQKYNIDSSL